MAQLDDIPEQLKMMVALEGDTIHMNVLAASSLVMEAIIEYKKEHGDINFQLQQNSESELYDIAVTTSLLGSREFRYICDRFCQHAGFTPRIIFESDNPSAVRNMIAANMGIGFWPEFTWGSAQNEHVQLLKIEEPVCQRDIIINYNQNKTDSHNVIEFYEFLTEFFMARKLKS